LIELLQGGNRAASRSHTLDLIASDHRIMPDGLRQWLPDDKAAAAWNQSHQTIRRLPRRPRWRYSVQSSGGLRPSSVL